MQQKGKYRVYTGVFAPPKVPQIFLNPMQLSRTKFSTAIQERNESIPLFASKLNSLFNTAFPNETEPNINILVIYKFLNGLRDKEEKKIVLQQKEKDDSLEKLIDQALKTKQ